MAEVVLRNRIHACLTEQFSGEDWYTTSGLLLPWQEALVDEAMKKFSADGKSAPPGQIVAELHFGFWTGFFNKAHESKGIAHSLAKPVFQYAPKYERATDKLGPRWNKIRNLRNRVFHHERILHWNDLSEQHKTMVETIGWISPELKEMAGVLDRFTMIHSAGIDPWKEKIQQHWPEKNGGLK